VQSDVDIITNANNGISFRADDFDETFSAATNQPFINNNFKTTGTIATATDKDMFKFTMETRQKLIMNAVPTSVGTGDAGSNLDIEVKLYNTSKTLIGTYNPVATLSASVDTILDAGAYYFLVDGVSNEFTPEYGSLGSYSIETSQSPLVTLPLHKFELQGSSAISQHKLTWLIEADEKVVHQALEVSKDGRHFVSVSELAINERSYQYNPHTTGPLQYRVNAKFDNGRQYYSNVIALHNNADITKPQLLTNVIRNNALIVNSNAGGSYIIIDYNGRMVAKGNIAQGASILRINHISSGIYFIHFTNGQTQNAERFVKE
jgi:hypothetical protein